MGKIQYIPVEDLIAQRNKEWINSVFYKDLDSLVTRCERCEIETIDTVLEHIEGYHPEEGV